MAQVDSQYNPNDPEDPNNPQNPQNQQQDGEVTQPATTGGGGAVTATGAGGGGGNVSGTAQPAQPFQNISSYLAANKPQSAQLANQVAGTVSNPINEASQGITQAADQFTQSVNSGYTPANDNLISAVSQNPNAVVQSNPENVTNFLAQLNNKYTGPTDFTAGQGYQDLQGKIATANAKANNTQSFEGIQSLLGDVEGPTTAGINKLDSLLLNMDPNNLTQIRDAGAGAANLLPTLQSTGTAQNALAAQGSQTAAKTSADALAALDTARTGIGNTLFGEQKTIEDMVNQYNQSVNVVNPVVQNIAQALQNFLANNPQIKAPADSQDPLAALRNLTSIAMPDIATYASPQDYAQIASLMSLGDTNAGSLPINSATAGQAQTFNMPTQLIDALGKAPDVQKALQQQIQDYGGQINSAVKPYQDLLNQEMTRADLVTQASSLSAQIPKLQQALSAAQAALQNPPKGTSPQELQAAVTAAQQALTDAQSQYKTVTTNPNYHVGNYWDQLAQMAQGLQWVNGTETSYQDLVGAINSELGKLGGVSLPSLSYAPQDVNIEQSAPIAPQVAEGVGKAANIGAAGATGASTVGSGILAGTEMAGAPLGTGFGAGDSALIGVQSGLQTLGPAALAAYGTANIAQNAAKDPIKYGLTTLANTGLSLATLSLPPQIFDSIGKSINTVLHDIGNFFKHLF